MSVFSSFVYSGGVYGPGYSSGVLTELRFIAKDVLRASFAVDLVTNDAFYDVSSYTLTLLDSATSDISIKRVLPFNEDTLVSNYVLLETDRYVVGNSYTLGVYGLTLRDGTALTSVSANTKPVRTKTDNMLAFYPAHFDKRPDSLLRQVITAISLEDDQIGGNRVG